jgi:GT2 family glycosyltransferase/glycosyltransferase involved in cell wall biosynthesis
MHGADGVFWWVDRVALGHPATIAGWIFSRNRRISKIICVVSDRTYPVNYGLERSDVYIDRKHPHALNCGFVVPWIEPASGRVDLYVQFDNGESVDIAVGRVYGENATWHFEGLAVESRNANIDVTVLKRPFTDILTATLYARQIGAIFGYLSDEKGPLPKLPAPPCILVSVYRGRKYLDPFFDCLRENTTTPFKLVVVDNGNEDADYREALATKVQSFEGGRLIRVNRNRGYVDGICHAFAARSPGHLVVLNTDLLLPKGWLERLVWPLFWNESIASVTPFSNSATICSFPNIAVDNPLFLGLSPYEIDEGFQNVIGRSALIDLPSGVGFCMAMNETVVQKIGFFDVETFGEGYAEENDWCLRAQANGYRNVMVPNLFVYHEHGGSYQLENKRLLLEKNLKVINDRFSGYHQAVSDFISADVLRPLRGLIAAIVAISAKPNVRAEFILLTSPKLQKVTRVIQERANEGTQVLIVCNCGAVARNTWYDLYYPGGQCTYRGGELREIRLIFRWLRISSVILDEGALSLPYLSIIRTILDCDKDAQISYDWIERLLGRQSFLEKAARPTKQAVVEFVERKRFLFVIHRWGGGAEKHVQDLANILSEDNVEVIFCRPEEYDKCVIGLTAQRGRKEPSEIVFDTRLGPEAFAAVLCQIGITHIHVHAFATFFDKAPDFFRLAAAISGIPYDLTMHDYESICPRLHLFDGDGYYCGEPDVRSCSTCLERYGSPFEGTTIWAWREQYDRFVHSARRTYVPDADVKTRIERYFSKLGAEVRPHPEKASECGVLEPSLSGAHGCGVRRVALLGAIGPHKGSRVLLETAKVALERNAALEFVVLGYTNLDLELAELPNVRILGAYPEAEGVTRLQAVSPDLAWFASTWPETYSYTLSIALRARVFPVSFDFGAIARRIRVLKWGLLLPYQMMLRPSALVDALLSCPITKPGERELLAAVEYKHPLQSYYDL